MIILDDKIVHLIAGGAGGTAGAIVTCPLEVVKTRLQSSVATFETRTPVVHHASPSHSVRHQLVGYNWCTCGVSTSTNPLSRQRPQPGIIGCLRYIIVNEGPRALFKGLGPNLVGVAPSRAIYFSAYSNTKNFLNSVVTPDTPLVHMGSACSAGFISCTATNPIWFVKTRLQLDQSKGAKKYGLRSCLRDIYYEGGIRAFYKGISASYYGISETVIHFVIYEYVKRKLREARGGCSCDQKTPRDFLEFMLSGAVSKTCASVIAYPHEVARTRLRQEGGKYRRFWQTLYTVFREEGWRAMYRGLATQLVRQIPNTAIMMATYESVVYLLSSHEAYDDDDDDDGNFMDGPEDVSA